MPELIAEKTLHYTLDRLNAEFGRPTRPFDGLAQGRPMNPGHLPRRGGGG